MDTSRPTSTALLLILLYANLACLSAKVPHVSECNTCSKCAVTASPKKWSLEDVEKVSEQVRARIQESKGFLPTWTEASQYNSTPVEFNPFMYMAMGQSAKRSLPNCTECTGCNTELSEISSRQGSFMGVKLTQEEDEGDGMYRSFWATTKRTASGIAMVRIYCVPPAHSTQSAVRCYPPRVVHRARLLSAMKQISTECGMAEILPNTWVDYVEAVTPGTGFHVRWFAVWMDIEPGALPLRLLAQSPQVPAASIVELLHKRLNRTQVLQAAIFDVLTMQCNHHGGTIFIDEKGNLKLMSSEVALRSVMSGCYYDSSLLPSSQAYAKELYGVDYVMKRLTGGTPDLTKVNPVLLLDYRCHVGDVQAVVKSAEQAYRLSLVKKDSDPADPPRDAAGSAAAGKKDKAARSLLQDLDASGASRQLLDKVRWPRIGKKLPPQVQQCLKDIDGKRSAVLSEYYGLPHFEKSSPAQYLKQRAHEMLDLGFEAALLTRFRNPAPKSYRSQPPCCQLAADSTGKGFTCAHRYQPVLELPLGDPMGGRNWNKMRKDPGSYEGHVALDEALE